MTDKCEAEGSRDGPTGPGTRLLGVGLVLLTLVGGCGSDDPAVNTTVPSDTPTSSQTGDTLRAPETAPTQPPYPEDDFTLLMLAVAEELDRQWFDVFESVAIAGAGEYESPDGVLGYRAGDMPDTVCARGSGPERWRNNAFYCPSDKRIVYDEDWLRGMAEKYGEHAPIIVLAHEWSHHAQSVFGVGAALDLPLELQADCFAGTYIIASGLIPHESVDGETPALLTTLETFFSLGNADYRESEWFTVAEHGSPQQRAMAASTGLLSNQEIIAPTGSMLSGLPSCYGYRDFVPSDTVDIGPYRLVEPPGLTTSFNGASYSVEPESRTGQEGSTVIMVWIDALPLGATIEQIEQLWALDAYRWARAIGDPFSLDANVSPGTGVAQYFELVPTNEQQILQSGFFSLVAPSSGHGGLLILVVRTQLAPTDSSEAADMAIVEEQVVMLYQIVNRLCSPDKSGDPSAPNFAAACMDGH